MYKLFLPLTWAALSIAPALAQAPVTAGNGTATSHLERVAEPAGPLTLSAALALTMQANPEVAAAGRAVDAAQGVIRQAGVLPNPEFSMSLEDRNKATRTTTLQLNQPIELGGKRAARVAAAEHGFDIAVAELHAKRTDVHAAVVAAFYETLIAQERYRLAQASVELAQHAVTIASKRVLTGKVSPVEETRARIAATGVRAELVQAASELSNARVRLAAHWGGVTPRFERAVGEADVLPPVPALGELMQRLQQAPGLLRARLEVERRQALMRVERSRQIPDLTLSVGSKRDEERGRRQAIVGVAIPLPLFDRNQGNLQEALGRADQARDELTAAEVRLASELAQAHARLSAARREAELLQQDVLPNAQSAYDAATKGFELGKFDFLDVLDAQRTLFQTRSQYLRALSGTHRAAADIERIVGAESAGKP